MTTPASLIHGIVIVGCGTAGWMMALGLATVVGDRYRIRLVESDGIGTVGVGEATIPLIQRFHRIVGIDEHEFLGETGSTFKLAIEFVNWGRLGDRCMRGFGRVGQDLWTVGFEQYWHRMRLAGRVRPLGDYAIAQTAARAKRFMPARPEPAISPLAASVAQMPDHADYIARHVSRQVAR